MPKLFDRVKVNIATTGTGSVTFGPASSPAFLTPEDAGAVDGHEVRYTLVDGTDFEEGIGTIFSSVERMARTTVTRSKIGGNVDVNRINLSGTAVLVFTASAADILNPANNLSDLQSPSAARSNLGLGTAATQAVSAFMQPAANLSEVLSPASARANLGLGSAATQPSSAFLPAFAAGTRILFQQSTAPVGWTKDTTHNDKALRIVSGAVGSGGSVAFSTLFTRTSVDSTTPTVATMAAHPHNMTGTQGVGLAGGSDGVYRPGSDTYADAVPSKGGGSSHTHGLDLRVQYVDLIIASKD